MTTPTFDRFQGCAPFLDVLQPKAPLIPFAASPFSDAIMTTTFQSVNVGLGLNDFSNEATSPTTPRALPTTSDRSLIVPSTEGSALTTPTRLSFGGVEGQRPLPRSPFSNSFPSSQLQPTGKMKREELRREDSDRSIQTVGSQDVDMDDSDEGDGDGGSDGESIDGETGRPMKKKKGQRFFCTDFPPCNLSFTRSEHLARHIRKHTGERPFQCHCSRRFSRLDNLRQHAQTVHVNEEIPGDSLAATGTRFQRQIRTDRVRPGSGRSRASTASSQGSHGRGHSRNLSTSSIGSTTSTISRDDGRRRPPPLMMASDPNSRARLSLDITRIQPSTPPSQYTQLRANSGDISTPTSTTYSNGPNSPGYGSSIGSPVSAATRGMSLWGSNPTHSRRLSVPSGVNPFQSPHGSTYPTAYLSPLAPSNSSAMSSNSSMYGSPTSSTYSFTRRDSALAAEAEWRRRTWHPSTYSNYSRPATSGLSYYHQTADAPQPAFAPQATQAASQSQRLPGIETFDQISHRPATPPRGSSPMQVDSPSRPPVYPGPSMRNTSGPNDRRGHASWDMSLHQNLTRLDIAAYGTSPNKDAGIWGQQTLADIQDAAAKPSTSQTHQAPRAVPVIHQESQKRPAETSYLLPTTPNRSKRHGWYAGPPPASQQFQLQQRRSPEDSSSSDGVPTPSFSAPEYHPSIVHSNGYIETNYTPTAAAAAQQNYTNHGQAPSAYPLASKTAAMAASQHGTPKQNDMSGLEVLVAVATSGEKVSTASTH